MICPRCQQVTPDDSRFCNQCGASLSVVCDICSTANASGSRFCSQCGRPLLNRGLQGAQDRGFARSPILGDEQRRPVTVLFADIVGFTSLSERLDPEEVRDVTAACFGRLVEEIVRRGGTVDKFIGDAVMVIFGAPNSDPEHAYHATACAVLMQQVLQRVNAQRIQRGEPAAQLRIGLNSGDMLAGLMGSSQRMEYTVVGDAVNLASRLCNEARPGEIVVSAPLYRALKGRSGLRAANPRRIRVRGKAEPVTICSILDIGHNGVPNLDDWLGNVSWHGVPA